MLETAESVFQDYGSGIYAAVSLRPHTLFSGTWIEAACLVWLSAVCRNSDLLEIFGAQSENSWSPCPLEFHPVHHNDKLFKLTLFGCTSAVTRSRCPSRTIQSDGWRLKITRLLIRFCCFSSPFHLLVHLSSSAWRRRHSRRRKKSARSRSWLKPWVSPDPSNTTNGWVIEVRRIRLLQSSDDSQFWDFDVNRISASDFCNGTLVCHLVQEACRCLWALCTMWPRTEQKVLLLCVNVHSFRDSCHWIL